MKDLIGYIEGLVVTQGQGAGDAFRLLPWQRRFLGGAMRDGVQTAALSVARGNGKTALLAAVATATVDGPLRRSRSETVVVASSFTQARVAFDHVLAYLRARHGRAFRSGETWRVNDTAHTALIEHRPTGARVRAIASDPARAHGLAPSLVLADEPAQWPRSTSDRMLAALRTSLGKQPGARLIAIGTRPADLGHWFWRMLVRRGADVAHLYAADEGQRPFSRAAWQKANPSLKAMPDLLAAIESEAKDAKADARALAMFRALRLNQGTPDTDEAVLVEAASWERAEGEAKAVGPTAWGVDLGGFRAMSAVACYWPVTGRLECIAAFPSVPSLQDRGDADAVADLYVRMAGRGELRTLGARVVPPGELMRMALSRWGRPTGIAGDRWREAELRDALDAAGVPAAMFEGRGQGWRDGAEDVRAFRSALLSGKVTPVVSLLMRSALGEARTVADPAGNEKLAKSSEGGRRQRARDDAAAAVIQAVALGARNRDQVAARPARRFRFALAR